MSNIITLNTVTLDSGVIIKKGEGGGTSPSPSRPTWTGHVDADGLKAIGWDDEDIAYYQEYGVNWMEEDDEYHLVSDDNKALYGVLTTDNIQEYKDRIVWLPKIDFSEVTNMNEKFDSCSKMVGIPILNTIKGNTFDLTFNGCYLLACVPPLDFSKAASIKNIFEDCRALRYVATINSSNAKNVDYVFRRCHSLVYAPHINLDSASSGRGDSFYNQCRSLIHIPKFRDFGIHNSAFRYTTALLNLKIDGLLNSLLLNESDLISKESILYIIEHEAATSAITITLSAFAYARLATDPDIVEALSNHPLVSLASA